MLNKNYLIWAVTALGLITVAEGAWIYRLHNKLNQNDMFVAPIAQDPWIQSGGSGLSAGNAAPFQAFDKLFDDDFFKDRRELFKGFDKAFGTLPSLPNEADPLFSGSWSSLFAKVPGEMGAKTEIEDKTDQVIVTLKVPGFKASSLKVDVNADRIRVSYESKVSNVTKDEKGTIIKQEETEQSFEKVLPVPKGADTSVPAKIETSADDVRIILKKKNSGGYGNKKQ